MTKLQSNLFKEFVILDPNKNASTVTVSPTVFEEIDRSYNGFKNHELISSFEFDQDWTTWEMHPNGDEIVVLLSGKATFLLNRKENQKSTTLNELGSYVIIPKGTWHTAKTNEPTKMLFITPGEGTLNENI